MNRKIPLYLLPVFITIAVYLFINLPENPFFRGGELTVSREGEAVVLNWKGKVQVPMLRQFREAISANRNNTNHFIIDLNSQGGALFEGSRVVNLINELKDSHLVDTRVRSQHYCLSMCVPIFLLGETREAAASSYWLFHEPRAFDPITEEEIEEPAYARRETSERFFQRYFVNSDMDPRWREVLRREWVGKDVWKRGQELVDERSNIITRLN